MFEFRGPAAGASDGFLPVNCDPWRWLPGISSGACLSAILICACRPEQPGNDSEAPRADATQALTVCENESFKIMAETQLVVPGPALDWLELADSAFTALLGPPPSAQPQRIVLFSGTDFWPRSSCDHPYDRLVEHGAAAFFARTCGMVHVRQDVTTANPEDLRASLLHEAVHQRVMRQRFPALSGPGAWISEGIGLYFECLDEDGRVDLGRSERLSQARVLFQSGRFLPLSEFTALDAEGLDALAQERVLYPWHGRVQERRVSLHHVQAFAVMAFIHRRFRPELRGLLEVGLSSGLSPEVLERHLGLGLSEIARKYEDSYQGLSIAGVDY